MGQSSLDSIYRNVPLEFTDELMRFRATHPIQRRMIDGVEWNYILSGEGMATILILGGLMSTAETSRSLIASMEESYRVLVPAYPVYEGMGAFVDGLLRLLDLESTPRVHVFGHSLGAGIAHVFIRRHPEKVDRLILSSFGLYNARNLQLAKRVVRLFHLLPYWFVSGYYKRRMPKLLAGVDEKERSFLTAYMNDVLDLQLNKRAIMSQFRIMEDMFDNPGTYGFIEPVTKSEVLILQAKDDTGFDPGEQEALRETYPNATVHLFEEGGHLTRTTHRTEYDAVLHEFLVHGFLEEQVG